MPPARPLPIADGVREPPGGICPAFADRHDDEHPVHPLDTTQLPQHLDRLYRAALAMTGSREDAEDLVQETCARVMRRPRFVRKDNDLIYLMRTMRNTWLNVRRGRGAEAKAIEETGTLAERLPRADPLISVEVRALLSAVAELPPIHRSVIVAVDVLGLSYKEAAKALGTREGTIMSRLFRARVQVARALGDDAPER
jgi:RNA polymerase sigma-70 factor (ECF subfamily)